MYYWYQNQQLVLLFVCSAVGIRWSDAFLAGGASVWAGSRTCDGSMALKSEVSESTLSMDDLAREWAARNSASDTITNGASSSVPASSTTTMAPPRESSSDSHASDTMSDLAREWATRNSGSDSINGAASAVRSSSVTAAPPSESSSEPAPASAMADLAREWEARNRGSDTIEGTARSTVPLTSLKDSVEVQTPSPAATVPETTPPSEVSERSEPEPEPATQSFDDLSAISATEPQIYQLTSVNKGIWLDEDTGRFYEGRELAALDGEYSDRRVSQRPQDMSTPKKFETTHGGFKALKKELEYRNTVVEGEDQYALADGELVEELASQEITDATVAAVNKELSENAQLSAEERKMLEQEIELLTKPRPYPIFLAEKAAELVESQFKGWCKPFKVKNEPLNLVSKSENIASYNREGKERIVILGTGWGAAAFLKDIDTDLYKVTVISPRNHFVFTPMLAGASVGTVEYRSICQPIREINLNAQFLEATATDVDPETQLLTCQSVICDGNSCDICEFTVRYDRLIVTVGAQTNTFGIPGVREYCCFLKQVEDARRIRTAIVNCFERASLPSLTDEEREHDLTFAVIGAGPTGIEFAAELRDFIEQDGPKYYPYLVKYIRIKVLVSSSTILRPFDKSLQDEAIAQMNRAPRIKDPAVRNLLPPRFKLTELLFDSAVKEITEKTIILKDGSVIPYGLAVWAAGNGPVPLTLHVIEGLGKEQEKDQDVARGRIAVDPWMRAVGGKGKILSFGDCSCICQGGQQLPATAQVASQQGEYLAGILNRNFDLCPPEPTNLLEKGILAPPMRDPKKKAILSDRIAGLSTKNDEYAKPFQFLNLGILAYTGGGSALAQVETTPEVPPVLGSGKIGNLLWRSVYLSKQVSWRNRLLVLNDWTKKQLFGRDITRV